MTIDPRCSAEPLFSALPLSGAVKQDLARRMAEPSRHYHGRAHIELLWQRHRLFASGSGFDDALDTPIALVIAFHDAVYVGGAPDNEARSAALWLEVSAGAGICDEVDRSWVADTILATADHIGAGASLNLAETRDRARQWVLDLDLTPLGEDAAVFDANMDGLAAELPGSSEESRETLLSALRHFATARPLYRCPTLRAAFEAPARDNFARHLRQP